MALMWWSCTLKIKNNTLACFRILPGAKHVQCECKLDWAAFQWIVVSCGVLAVSVHFTSQNYTEKKHCKTWPLFLRCVQRSGDHELLCASAFRPDLLTEQVMSGSSVGFTLDYMCWSLIISVLNLWAVTRRDLIPSAAIPKWRLSLVKINLEQSDEGYTARAGRWSHEQRNRAFTLSLQGATCSTEHVIDGRCRRRGSFHHLLSARTSRFL